MPCQPTEKGKKIIRAMAANRVRAGMTDAEQIIDSIHAAIHEHTPLLKSEIAEIVKKELPGYSRPNDIRQGQLRHNMSDIEAKRAEIERRRGKDLPTDLRKEGPKFQYDESTRRLEEERDALRAKADKELQRLKYENQTPAARMADTAQAYRRFMLLTGIRTLGKLAGAAGLRIAITPVEQGLTAIMKHLPGIATIARQAPREGAASLRAEAEAFRRTFSRETLEDMWKTAKGDTALWEAKHKDDRNFSPHPWMDIPGQIHAAFKTPAKKNEYFRSLQLRTESLVRAAAKDGAKPEEIEAMLRDPVIQASVEAKAYEDANRAIFMNESATASAIRGASRFAKNYGKPGSSENLAGQFIGRMIDFSLPIVKVPINVVKETGQYMFGAIGYVPVQIASVLLRRGLKGMKELDPDMADSIMRNLKKGTMGTALLMAGYMNPRSVGGYYQQGDIKDKKRYESLGSIEIAGHKIPKIFLHNPAMEMVQIGATIRRVEQGIMTKKGAPRHGTGTMGAGIAAGLRGVAEELPFLSLFQEWERGLESSENLSTMAGETVSDLFIPPDVKYAAKEGIPGIYEGDKGRRRQVHGFTDAIQSHIPELREKLPLKP